MQAPSYFTTSFTRLSPAAARGVLVAWLLVTIGAIGITISPLKSGYADAPDRGPGDLALFQAKIQRMREGDNYYQAANQELRARGYPTRSVFNWRTPLPMTLLAAAPPLCGRLLIGGLALLAVYFSFTLMEREASVWQGAGCGILMIGALIPCVLDGLYVAPELWAAVLLTLSLCAYARERPILGVALALSALLMRDLAGLYCLVMGLMAIYSRRWSEVMAWIVALLLYAAFYAWHVLQVLPLMRPGDLAHSSWLQLGGLPFILSVCQMNMFLLLSPQWLTAVAFAMALMGMAGWNTPTGTRIGIALMAYLVLFAAVGHPFNQYWGSLIAPLLCFGIARFPATLGELRRLSRQPARGASLIRT